MLPYVLLAIFCLKAGTEALDDAYRVRIHHPDAPLLRNYLAAPNVLEDRETFIVIDYEEEAHQSPPQLRVVLRLFNDSMNAQPRVKECPMTLTGRPGANRLGVRAILQFDRTKAVFTWDDEIEDDVKTRLVAVDINDCRHIDLNVRELSGNSHLVPTAGDNFELFVDDEALCKKVGKRCIIECSLSDSSKADVRPFNVNLDWWTMDVERLDDGDYVLRGLKGTTFKVMRMNHLTGETQLLIHRLMNASRDMEFVSSKLTFCWIMNPGVDKHVSCVQKDANNKRSSVKTIKYDHTVSYIDVRNTQPGQFIVVARKADCYDDNNCPWSAVITGENLPTDKIIPLYFPCKGDRVVPTAFDTTHYDEDWTTVNYDYLCRNENNYYFNVFHIQ